MSSDLHANNKPRRRRRRLSLTYYVHHNCCPRSSSPPLLCKWWSWWWWVPGYAVVLVGRLIIFLPTTTTTPTSFVRLLCSYAPLNPPASFYCSSSSITRSTQTQTLSKARFQQPRELLCVKVVGVSFNSFLLPVHTYSLTYSLPHSVIHPLSQL